ncbi:MAG: InlB B-repeat-containing protein, partial [Bacteroidales bacterium]|nr:InlB B-repeat-containing protein [Bacteroidales bacterium]
RRNGIEKEFFENVDITASTNAGDILSKEQPITVGSVVAWQTSGTIEGCFATGNIQTSGKGNVVGGIVGNMKGGTIKNNLSTVSIHVSGDESYVGGAVGVIRGSATLQSVAYDGNSLVNNGNGAIGGVIGYLENGTATVSHTYFDTDIVEDGIGLTAKDSGKVELKGSTSGKKDLNSSEVVCGLNNGNLDEGTCPDGIWNQGATHISLNKTSLNENGKIVYQITFDANKGVFSKSAKTSKLLEAGEAITATEITEPVRGDTVFAGWALTADAESPAANLGIAAKATTVYAVWKKMFKITFDANGGAFLNDAGETITGNASKTIADSAEINTEGIRIGTSYGVDETTFYFVGWATEKDAEEPLESLGLATDNTTFYALWREEVTYTVTFDAGIGGYSVAFVKEDGKYVVKLAWPALPEGCGGKIDVQVCDRNGTGLDGYVWICRKGMEKMPTYRADLKEAGGTQFVFDLTDLKSAGTAALLVTVTREDGPVESSLALAEQDLTSGKTQVQYKVASDRYQLSGTLPLDVPVFQWK